MAPRAPTGYRIGVRGHLDPSWSEYFDGLTITQQPNGETVIVGPVRDQAALFGILMKVRDLSDPSFGDPR